MRVPALVCSTALLLLVALAGAQTPQVPCEASPEVRQSIESLPSQLQERIAASRALVERHPNDVFAHQAYQDVMKYAPDKGAEPVIAEYRAAVEKHPNDPMFRHLAVRASIGTKTKEAITALEALLQPLPGYPLAHQSLADIYRSPNFKDNAKYAYHAEALLKACPSNISFYSYLRTVEPSDFVRESAARLRRMMESRTDGANPSGCATLWTLEFRLAPAAERDQVRKRIAEDVKRLRAAMSEGNRSYLYALREGYQLLADAENLKWAEEQIKKQSSSPAAMGAMGAYQQWRDKHPYPKPDDPPEKRAEYTQEFLKASEQWIREYPDDMGAWLNRHSALWMAENAPPGAVEQFADNFMRLQGKTSWNFSWPSLMIADLYARHRVRLDQVPALVDKGLQEAQKTMPSTAPSDLYPRDRPGMPDAETSRLSTQFSGLGMAAGILLRIKNTDKAREVVQQMEALLPKLKPSGKADAKDSGDSYKQRSYPGMLQRYWDSMGRLAELENRKMDALTCYQNALLARPRSTPAPAKDELAEKARALWKEFGGTNEGWQAWYTRAQELSQASPPAAATATGPPGWIKMDRKLPEFALADMTGRKWTPADFKGKTVFINLWASW